MHKRRSQAATILLVWTLVFIQICCDRKQSGSSEELNPKFKKVIFDGLRKRLPPTDYLNLTNVHFEDTIVQWSIEKNDWEKRLRYLVDFEFKKNNALENRKAGIAVFLNKDSINNIVILPKDYRQDDGE
jgi:hypothetical protein